MMTLLLGNPRGIQDSSTDAAETSQKRSKCTPKAPKSIPETAKSWPADPTDATEATKRQPRTAKRRARSAQEVLATVPVDVRSAMQEATSLNQNFDLFYVKSAICVMFSDKMCIFLLHLYMSTMLHH